MRRFEAEGEAGLEPHSRRPRASPSRTPGAIEDEIVVLRKALNNQGLDAGAHTIAYHLLELHGTSPSPATIWRILSRRGFVSPQPHKRPKSSFIRFEADLPNERWQAAHGFPASVLTDNGAVFTGTQRGGRSAMEVTLASLGISHNRSRIYHP